MDTRVSSSRGGAQESQQGAPFSMKSTPKPVDDLMTYCRDYARQSPEKAAMWCFGIGFVLGWRLKPW